MGGKAKPPTSLATVSVKDTPYKQNENIDKGRMKQLTRGHNIVADGWAGASNPYPPPTPHIHSNLKKKQSRTVG